MYTQIINTMVAFYLMTFIGAASARAFSYDEYAHARFDLLIGIVLICIAFWINN